VTKGVHQVEAGGDEAKRKGAREVGGMMPATRRRELRVYGREVVAVDGVIPVTRRRELQVRGGGIAPVDGETLEAIRDRVSESYGGMVKIAMSGEMRRGEGLPSRPARDGQMRRQSPARREGQNPQVHPLANGEFPLARVPLVPRPLA
jgi:hypothetical protein